MIEGADTELDRSVIDEIAEPLLHLLRNSIDHGIETPDERARGRQGPDAAPAAGRPSRRRPDPDRGRGRRARHRRRGPPGGAREGADHSRAGGRLDDREAVDLVFLPGLSTAARSATSRAGASAWTPFRATSSG